jgi:hypothetical protein
MIDVDVKIVYGDYMLSDDEQEWHDERVSTFKWQLADIIKSLRIDMSVRLVIDCEYYPETRKFKIKSSTSNYTVYVQRAQDLNPKFVKEYL